jgi:hypothetical protein
MAEAATRAMQMSGRLGEASLPGKGAFAERVATEAVVISHAVPFAAIVQRSG